MWTVDCGEQKEHNDPSFLEKFEERGVNRGLDGRDHLGAASPSLTKPTLSLTGVNIYYYYHDLFKAIISIWLSPLPPVPSNIICCNPYPAPPSVADMIGE